MMGHNITWGKVGSANVNRPKIVINRRMREKGSKGQLNPKRQRKKEGKG